MSKPITVHLVLGKETKGTHRYEAEDPEAAVTTLYVRKASFDGAQVPQAIELQLHEVKHGEHHGG